MILTNPPFGGEEERGILGNFPDDKQTAETALLFLQLIMRKLRARPSARKPRPAARRGRAQRHAVRRRRLRPHQGGAATEFNLHTIVRLPNGVFAPYTEHPDEPAVLRPRRPDQGHLVLRAAAARGPQELHQDQAACSSRSSPTAWLVGRSARRTSGPGRCRPPTCSRSTTTATLVSVNLDIKNPNARRGPGTPAARATGRGHPGRRSADHRDSWRRSRRCWEIRPSVGAGLRLKDLDLRDPDPPLQQCSHRRKTAHTIECSPHMHI